MCYTCGCNRPYDDTSDPKTVTERDFEAAGQIEAIQRAGTAEAKRQLRKWLQMELERDELGKPRGQY